MNRTVYLIESVSFHAMVKVGSSAYPLGRAETIAKEHGDLRLLLTAEGDYAEEAAVHAIMRRTEGVERYKGDWYTGGSTETIVEAAIRAISEVCGADSITVDGTLVKQPSAKARRTERVNVFCTPKEAADLKVQAVLAGKSLNQHILDSLGVAQINTGANPDASEASPVKS